MLRLNPKQKEAAEMLSVETTRHGMLYGGSRSGKTFVAVMCLVARAMRCPGSRHGIIRKFLASLKRSVWKDTLPKACRLLVPDAKEYKRVFKFNNQDLCLEISTGKDSFASELWLCGLDDEERADRILGMEFSTLMFEECSELDFNSVQTALTRLAQRNELVNRAIYTQNPPSKRHWTYTLFVKKEKPVEGGKVRKPIQYQYLQMNPFDNISNLDPEYVDSLEDLPWKQRERFLNGEFQDDSGRGPVRRDWLRYIDPMDLPELVKIVVSVDPSVEDNEDIDECGIVAVGKCKKDNFYVLVDATFQGSPLQWSRRAVMIYQEFECDYLLYEKNQGGLLVESAIHNVDSSVPCKGVRAKRGKMLRAESASVLYERSRVFHCRQFFDLEDELCDYDGEGPSPNRLDAIVYALIELSGGPQRLKVKPMDFTGSEEDTEKMTAQERHLQPTNEALWEEF